MNKGGSAARQDYVSATVHPQAALTAMTVSGNRSGNGGCGIGTNGGNGGVGSGLFNASGATLTISNRWA